MCLRATVRPSTRPRRHRLLLDLAGQAQLTRRSCHFPDEANARHGPHLIFSLEGSLDQEPPFFINALRRGGDDIFRKTGMG